MSSRQPSFWLGLGLAALMVLPLVAYAQVNPEVKPPDPIIFTPQIPIPGTPGFAGAHPITENTIGEYFQALYIYFISAVGVIAITMIIYGGFRWITAAGNPSRIQAAQDTINSALIGLVLALTSYLILNSINPNLVRFRIPVLVPIQQQLQAESIFCNVVAKGTPAENAECGKQATYTDAANNQQTCWGGHVNPNIGLRDGFPTKDSLICAWNKKQNQYVPAKIKEYCTSKEYTSNNECERADTIIKSVYPEVRDGDHVLACRKDLRDLSSDVCVLNRILACPQSSQTTQIGCNEFGSQVTPCWTGSEPGVTRQSSDDRSGLGNRCSDTPRAVVGADAICCAYAYNKNPDTGNRDIICDDNKPTAPSPREWNRGYVELETQRCADLNEPCSGNEKCWMLMEIY
ncbi:MAG: hypothetical protein HYZ09_04360 [Candidatus Kerfeldbacteria bacterium]|nr:hypothetical protein [Candidatus Kerfeldbacteria bacterium]